MPTLKELTDKRVKCVNDARALNEKATAEKRELTPEESKAFDGYMNEADQLKTQIDGQLRSEQRTARLAGHDEDLDRSRGRRTEPDAPGREGEGREDRTVKIRERTRRHRAGTAEHRRLGTEYRAQFNSYLAGEVRALQTDLDTAGGYIVPGEDFIAELLKDLDDEVYIRSLARKFVTNRTSLGAPRRTSKLASAVWGSEIGAPTADTALKFGKRSLTPHYQTSSILVSNDLLMSAVMDAEAMVREELARDAGELEERAFLTGSGAEQPLGVFTVSNDGITTSRDVSTGNSSTAITIDGLKSAVYKLKQAYRKRAQWMFHRDAVAMISKLKDSTNQYLWQPSNQLGQPDRLLNIPITESEWVPNTFTTGLYVGILADWSKYWIVDGLDFGIRRLDELNARTHQAEFIARRQVDGAPTIEEAFVRVTLA